MKSIYTNEKTGETITQIWVGFKKTLNDFKELLLLGGVRVFPEINEIIENQESPFVISKIDRSMTKTTGEEFVFYKLSDRMEILLSTLRAGNGNSDVGKIRG